jgi:hypothetical protein
MLKVDIRVRGLGYGCEVPLAFPAAESLARCP